MPRSHVRALASLVLAALCFDSSPALATRVAPEHMTSWGKAEVSLEEYWTDASECGHAAAATDLKDTDPGKALAYASRMLDSGNWISDYALVARMAPPEVQWNRAATILENALETCLAGRGYVKFRLTDRQFRQLKKLPVGSLERREFLHGLASDPAVLTEQAV